MKYFICLVSFLVFIAFGYTQETISCKRFDDAIDLYNKYSIKPITPKAIDVDRFTEILLTLTNPNNLFFELDEFQVVPRIGEEFMVDSTLSFCRNFNQLQAIYTSSISKSLLILEELMSESLLYTKQDSFYFWTVPSKSVYQRDMRSRWEAYIKFKTLDAASRSETLLERAMSSSESTNSILDSLKVRTIAFEQKRLNELLEDSDKTQDFLYYSMVNSLMQQFDEYSYLFSMLSFKNFKEQLSTHTQSYGLVFDILPNGSVVVLSIIPGSYAWRTGSVSVGDEIISLRSPTKKEELTIRSSCIEEMIDYLINSNELTFVLLSKNGQEKVVNLLKEETMNASNAVQSLILNGPIRAGYIKLPAFYTSWDSISSSRCSQDVGNALYALKNQKIEALILDLRDNGGGSVFEAIDLAGIFIDFGPITIVQGPKNEVQTIKDFNRGTMYSDPLAILINSGSASASEIVAAALQDYNRAIVIGSSSYGKALGQTLHPLNENNDEVLKLTTSSFFRITGNSYHKTGVIPDIQLPYINFTGRRKKEQVETWTISKKTYYTPLAPLPKNELNRKSNERVRNSDKFSVIARIDNEIGASQSLTGYTQLDLNTFYTRYQRRSNILKDLEALEQISSTTFTVEYLKSDRDLIKLYPYFNQLLNELSKEVGADPYIEETLNVLNHYKSIK